MAKEKEEKKGDEKGITIKKEENIVDWYSEVIQKAQLADYAPIKGFMVIRPNAYAIWEEIKKKFSLVLDERGVRDAYFPALIPESFFKKEAEHAEGFAPELAYIQQKEEGERFALRPTSETIMYDSYSKWIRSWRDLPLKINQWCNVFRWEVKQTKPFLRTREFLWQEGHNVFETENEAIRDMDNMILEYKKLIEEELAIAVLVGRKSLTEKFPGAITTMSVEALMPDGKALQCGTSHNLGQGFAKSFGIKFTNRNEKEEYPWQTSWGFSTRLIGALIMTHGDNKGLVLPPRIAKNKIVIIPLLFEDSKEKVMKKAMELKKIFGEFGAFIDAREEVRPGWKYSEWELKGIPLRLEVGPKDIEKKQVVIVRRDNGEKSFVSEKDLKKEVEKVLEKMQSDLLEKSRKFLKENMEEAKTIQDMKKKIESGKIVKAYFLEDKKTEEKIKAETGALSRVVEDVKKEGVCIATGKKSNTIGYFARNY